LVEDAALGGREIGGGLDDVDKLGAEGADGEASGDEAVE